MEELFKLALGLGKPWIVEKIEFNETSSGKVLGIFIDFEAGHKYEFEGQRYSAYDHQKRTWRHLNFFQHECYLHANVPRIRVADGSVKLVQVPWATPGSSFTLLFQAYALLLAQSGLSMSAVGRHMDVSDQRIMRFVKRIVTNALTTQEIQKVKHLGVDETSSKRGHNYLTVMHDLEEKKVVGIGIGKDVNAFESALIEMEIRGAEREKVKSVTMDMSKSFIAGACQFMPEADIVFDRFHLCQPLNKAVDEIRKKEYKAGKELKKTKYLWLQKGGSLNNEKQERIKELSETFPDLGVAYRLKEQFRLALDLALGTQKLKPINDWIKTARESGIEEIIKVTNTYLNHWYGIKKFIKHRHTNAYVEGINLGIQNVKRIARGYSNMENFRIMIYLKYAKLDLTLTHYK